MTRFLPAGIFSIFVPVLRYREKSSLVCVSLSVRRAISQSVGTWSKVKVGFRFLVLSQNSTFPTSAFSFPSNLDLALRKSVRPSEVRRHARAFGGGRNFEKYGLNLGFTQTWVWGKLGFETCPNLNLERFDGLEILSSNRSGEFGI
jgi:hypothetical protein